MFVVATVFILMYLIYKNSLCKGILVMSSRCFSSAQIRQLSALTNLQIFFTRSVWLLASSLPFRLQFRAVFSSLSYSSYMYGLSNPSHIWHFSCSIGPQILSYFRIYPSDLQILGVETVS